MKKFIKKLLVIFFIVIAMFFCLDVVFTSVYTKSQPRSKAMLIANLKNQNFETIFLGSSRVENTVDTRFFENLSGEKSFNFGVSGGGFAEYLMILKVLLENKNQIKKIYLQIDHINFPRGEANEKLTTVSFLPYINKSEAIETFFKSYDDEYVYLKYIPFYRYAINDSKLGFREVLNTAIGRPLFDKKNKGYYPLDGINSSDEFYKLPLSLNKNNPFLDELVLFCKKKNIDIEFFISPICDNSEREKFVRLLKKRIPDLMDFSSVAQENEFFDCGHLNKDGAKRFTKLLFERTKGH